MAAKNKPRRMLTNEVPVLDTVDAIAEDMMSGNAHFRAWCAILDAVKETAPEALADRTKSPVDNICAWIRSHKKPS
jgi:hypothetical protein